MKRYLLGAFIVPLLVACPAAAAHWHVDYAKSRLGFTVQWSNAPFSAQFKHWNADIDFDPDDLAHAHVTASVDLGSETSDEPDFDSGLKGAQGFETSHFPEAHFVATGFTRKSANSYDAHGTLAIHGIIREINLPFTLALDGGTAHMTGIAHVLRTDFGLGQGQWAASDPVAHDVAITIDLFATR
jgi:polyisoprenoid-binding protein YceI